MLPKSKTRDKRVFAWEKKKENKTKRDTKIDEIQAQLCDILGGSQRHVIDEADIDDDDFCMYLVDRHPNEWNVYLVSSSLKS